MRLTVQLTLPAGRSEVWAAVSTIGGLNREVAPFMRQQSNIDSACSIRSRGGQSAACSASDIGRCSADLADSPSVLGADTGERQDCSGCVSST